jgi:F-type H+-transporting ATPase subunit b
VLFDWFTVGAQALNFVILVWLMKHFLYQPILHSIDEREKLIAKELSDAKAAKADALKEQNEFLKKNQDYDKQSAALFTQATAAANVERQRLIEEAKKATVDWSLKRQAALINEEKNLHQAISQRTQEEIFLIARKTLSDLAGLDVEDRMVDVFIRRLRQLPAKEKDTLISEARKSKSTIIVRSAFNLLGAQRASMEAVIKDLFGSETAIQFQFVPGLICGIVLFKNDAKVAWCIDDYLSSMQNAVEELLHKKQKEDVKLEVKSEPKPEPKVDSTAKEGSNAPRV